MWHAHWETVVRCAGCLDSSMSLGALATNANVTPTMRAARTLWRDADLRAPLLATWELEGLDAHAENGTVAVAHEAVFRQEGEWTLVDLRTERFELAPRDVAAGAAQFVSMHAETALAMGAARAFSRNVRMRREDLALDGLDALGLARNRALHPRWLLRDRRRAYPGFHAELSSHPRLAVEDVAAHGDAPWCWYALSRSPNVTTPATHAAYRATLPFSASGIAVNPAFDEAARAAAGVTRPWSCARHGHACMFCTAAAGACGAPEADRLPDCVAWDVYLRITDDLTAGLRRACDRGVFSEHGFSDRAVGACSAAIGNPCATLGQAAWCAARLRAMDKLGAWTRVTLAANEMRASKLAAYRESATFLRARAPAVVQLLVSRGLPASLARVVLSHCARLDPPFRVVGRVGVRALVHFECGLRPDAASVWLPVTDPFAQ